MISSRFRFFVLVLTLVCQTISGKAAVVECNGNIPKLNYSLPATNIKFVRIWNKNSRPTPAPDLFLSDEVKASALLDSEGYIWLFRVIGGEYKKGFNKSKFIQAQGDGYSESGYSYSLSPHVGLDWSPNGGNILVSRQNLQADHLTFPRDYLEDVHPLTVETKLGEMLDFYEVKVPVKTENVMAIIEEERFNQIATSFGESSFPMSLLLSQVLCDSKSYKPSEVAPASSIVEDQFGSCSFKTDKLQCFDNIKKSDCKKLDDGLRAAPSGHFGAEFKEGEKCQ